MIRVLSDLVKQLVELQKLQDEVRLAELAMRSTVHPDAHGFLTAEYENPRASSPNLTVQ